MAGSSGNIAEALDGYEEKISLSSLPPRSNVLANRLTAVLSASYADSEIRDALHTLDESFFQNTAQSRRTLRLDVQKEVIDCDGGIVKEFGLIAEVCLIHTKVSKGVD